MLGWQFNCHPSQADRNVYPTVLRNVNKHFQSPLTSRKMIVANANPSSGLKDPHLIFGIHVLDRSHHAVGVQAVLTEFGENIKTRLGLHELHEGASSPNGLLLIEFIGDKARAKAFAERLGAISGIEVKQMVFDH
jgi:hypothetical protein